uniref:RiboL-PSP-HEPN domain-containing protein n=1 Tax=Caulobacter sp. (strain K31) TaxID=366602 RepID=B0T5H5_CAUSK
MIAKSYILENLRNLDAAYKKADSAKHGLYFSKLAVLELCGWIEISMDDMVDRFSKRVLNNEDNLKYVTKDVIRKTSGFDYKQNFRMMIVKTAGICNCERIEDSIPPAVLVPFAAELGNLKSVRDRLAHTYVKGTTASIDAPSVTKARFEPIFVGLKAFDEKLRSIN